MLRRVILVVACLLLGAASPPSLVFLVEGRKPVRLELPDVLKQSPSQDVAVTDPHDRKPHRYRAVLLAPLLEKAFGAGWDEAGVDLIFKAQDGYEVSIPAPAVAQGRPLLAYAAVEGPFTVENVNQHEMVELGPFYLVWQHGESGGKWPYQVVSIERSRFADRYPGITPAATSSPAVKRGFETFKERCLFCHSLRGQGGMSSFDLVSPRNVTRYLPREYLKAFIKDPGKFHGQSKMPPLSPELPNHEQTIEDLLEYLASFPE